MVGYVLYKERSRHSPQPIFCQNGRCTLPDFMEAAYTIWATVNVNMIAAIKDITIWQGIDPRSYAMVAGGGACGLHAIALAEGLEMDKLLIPRTAGGPSAVGAFSPISSRSTTEASTREPTTSTSKRSTICWVS